MPLTRRNKAKKALKPTEVKSEEENASDETSSEMKVKEESSSETSSRSSKRKVSIKIVKEEVVLDEEALKRKEIQSLWKVPAIAQFVSLYRFAFKLPEIEIEELEDGILDASAVGSKIVLELLVNILRSIYPCKGINADNFEEHLRRIANKIKATGECANVNLSEEVRFIQLDLESKVDLLYSLCLTRLDRPDVLDAMKDMDAETLRVQPLGCDDLGNEYWYFYGTRLYKQEPSKLRKRNWQEEWADQKNQSFGRRGRGRPKKNSTSNNENEDTSENKRYMNIDEKSRWSVACNTIEDWVTFAEKLKKSKSKCERALFLTITDNFLPVLNEIYQEKERKLQEKLRELIPAPVPRRMETRRMTRKVTNPDMDAYDDNAHKEHLARDRAHRLEERNRRLAREDRSSSRSRRRTAYYDDDFVDDFYDDYEEASPQNQSVPESNTSNRTKEQIHQYVPLASSSRNDLKSKVLHVLSEVKLQKDSWPFLCPVEETYAPGYYDIVENPMDLQTMSRKLLQNEYQTVNDIDKDFELMVSNCKLYNGEYHEMTKMVISLWKVFRKGLTKAFGSKSEEKDKTSEPSAKIQRISIDIDTEDASYESKFPEPTKKPKPKRPVKSRTTEALEVLSREAELAVEETQRSPDFSQIDTRELVSHPAQYSMYSDLKIVPINNHSSSLIEKFSSDSSNHDDDFEMDGAPRYLNDESTAIPPVVNDSSNQEPTVQSRRTTPTIHYMSSEFSELMDKAGSGNNDAASNPEEAPNANDLNTSAASLSSLSSTSPSLSAQDRNSSPHLSSIPEENPPPLQPSSYSSLSDLANFTSSFETSTVNAAALGLPSSLGSYKKPYGNSQVPITTSFGNYSQAPISSSTVQAPVRMNPELSMPLAQNQGVQVMRESTQVFQAQRSNVTMSYPSSHHHQVPMVTTAQPSKAFPDSGNVVVQSQGENKYPNLKFSLPPSNGEILLVPGDPASSGMTFHLYAQPTSNQSQPIQSSIELKHGNGNSPIQHFSNQQATNTMLNQVQSSNQMSRGETTIRPQKRKSPHLSDQQDSSMPKTQTTTSLPYPASSLPKTSVSTASTKTSEMAPIRQPIYANSLNSVLQSSAPQQRPVYNQFNVGKSAFQPRANVATTRTSVPLQQTGDSYLQRTMATVMPSVLSTTAMATGSVMSRPSNITMKTVQIPNGLVQSGQLIYVQQANREKRLPGEEQGGKMQSLGGKPVVTQAVTGSPYLQSANTNVMMQSAAFQNGSMNPSQVYTQVVPSQMQPQFINNNPYYIIADPNAFQGAQRYPVMNVQHVPFNNR